MKIKALTAVFICTIMICVGGASAYADVAVGGAGGCRVVNGKVDCSTALNRTAKPNSTSPSNPGPTKPKNPNKPIVACTMDAKQCPDGSWVSRVGPYCKFQKCRGGGGGQQCTEEAKLCPDGSYVVRKGPNCEFEACPIDDDDIVGPCVVGAGGPCNNEPPVDDDCHLMGAGPDGSDPCANDDDDDDQTCEDHQANGAKIVCNKTGGRIDRTIKYKTDKDGNEIKVVHALRYDKDGNVFLRRAVHNADGTISVTKKACHQLDSTMGAPATNGAGNKLAAENGYTCSTDWFQKKQISFSQGNLDNEVVKTIKVKEPGGATEIRIRYCYALDQEPGTASRGKLTCFKRQMMPDGVANNTQQ